MGRIAVRAGAAFVLALGTIVVPTLAEDTKPSGTKAAQDAPEKAPTFPGYVFVADVVGEVVKADDKSVTVRITWYEVQQSGNNKNQRPRLSSNNRNFRNPYAPNMNRPKQPQPQVKEQHHDYTLEYLPASLVRTKILPPKLDDKGKKVPHTQSEIDELRKPEGAHAYAANRSDLTPGTIVEVYLIRDKTVTAAKATEDDLRVKYAVILGHDANPPKDIGSGSTKPDEKKKKN